MSTKLRGVGPQVRLATRVVVVLALGAVVLAPAPRNGTAQAQTVSVTKSCSRCGRTVPPTSRAGQDCPYCGAYWGSEVQRPAGVEAPRAPQAELLSPGGKWRVVAGGDGHIRIYEAGSGAHVLTLAHLGPLDPEAFAPGDDAVVTIDPEGRVRVYALPTGAPQSPKFSLAARAVRFTPAGAVMVLRPATVSFYDPDGGRLLASAVRARPNHAFVGAVLSRDGSRLVATEDDGRATLWDAATGRPLAWLGDRPARAAFSPDGRYLLCFGPGDEPLVAVFDLGGLQAGRTVKLEPVGYAPFTPEGRRIAVVDGAGAHFLEDVPALARARDR